MSKKETYDSAIKELEEIVAGMEDSQISIDTLSEKVKRATELIKTCKSKLYKTEEDVKKVLEGLEDE